MGDLPAMEEVADGVVVATGTHVSWTLVVDGSDVTLADHRGKVDPHRHRWRAPPDGRVVVPLIQLLQDDQPFRGDAPRARRRGSRAGCRNRDAPA